MALLNLAVSKMIFASLNTRLAYLKFKNRFLKNTKVGVTLSNDDKTTSSFVDFLNKGYDKINIGGGSYNLEGFVNLDFVSFPGVFRQVVANITDLSFIPDHSVSHIYSNQVLEHLNHEQLVYQFTEYKRILKDSGIISFRTPNALGVSYGFWFGAVPEADYDEFLDLGYPKDAFFCDARDAWYHRDFFAFIHWIYADVGNIKNQHLSIFTPTYMAKLLADSGYEILKMTKPETSQIIVIAKPVK